VSALPLRDRAALAELGAQRFLSRRQLEELLLAESTLAAASRATVVKRILRRLRERGLVQVSPRLFEGLDGIPGETAYSLTPVGRRVRERPSMFLELSASKQPDGIRPEARLIYR
jgi:hypothetical protein